MGRKNRNKKKDPPKSKAAAAAASPTSRSSPESGESQESEASAWKDRGNSLYGSQQYDQAVTAYRAGLQILQEQAGDSQESDSLSIPLRGNLAMTLLKLEKFEEANEECTYVLDRYPDQTKALYRRALAREGMSRKQRTSPEDQKKLYIKAMDDLQRCLDVLDRGDSVSSDLSKTKQSAQSALDRLEAAFNKWRREGTRQEDDCAGSKGTAVATEGGSSPKSKARETKDDDDSDDSSVEDEKPLGPIDNSLLLLDRTDYHLQWFIKDAADDQPLLRPNLVRGYHFEVLPREVYSAFRSWYGEVTPSLCRRTASNGIVSVYKAPKLKVDGVPRSKSHRCSACGSRGAISRCRNCMAAQYCNRGCQEAHWPFHKTACKEVMKSGSKTAVGKTLNGCVGLNNLGNTCFMNSALQSLSHATPLTRHFLSNKVKGDVNTSNPLGTGGKLALAYDAVMKEIWLRNKGTATSPTALKRAIALFAPRFAGCHQHDAQEFLAYLLDGLHEDLNRIREAPYVEMPDVTDGQNMAIAGAEAWDAHKRRNDSLVLDSFYGQFQSTCICPQCNKVSVSFDVFNHASLEIPQVQRATVTVPVLLIAKPPSEGSNGTSRNPQRYGITLRRHCTFADVKQALANVAGVPSSDLIFADIYESTIYELINDKRPVANIRPNDIIVAFEVAPYDNSSVHLVATHSLKIVDKNGKEQFPNFGFPFMSSFNADLTCREVWDHVWNFVGYLVEEEGHEPGYIDAMNRLRREETLTIRVVTNQGRPIPLFSTEDGATTSEIPFDVDEKMSDALGDGCTDSFLFLSLEWKNPRLVDGEEIRVINPKAFAAYQDHQTLLDAMQQERLASKGEKTVTLDQCLQNFTKPERLDENNKWYCSKCKEHVRAMKTMKLWRLPNILVIHLKRFEFKHALRRDKLSTFVDYPLEGLDMKPHCENWNRAGADWKNMVDSTVDANYDLFAVVNHYGRMGFGHYTAFCRRWDEYSLSPNWNLFDDSNVKPANSSDVVGPAGYVLFYRRRQFH